MGRAVTLMSMDALVSLHKTGSYVVKVRSSVPDDAELRGVMFDHHRDAFVFRWEHPDFPHVPEGEELPVLDPPAMDATEIEVSYDEKNNQVVWKNWGECFGSIGWPEQANA